MLLGGIGVVGAAGLAACAGDDDLPTTGGPPLAGMLEPFRSGLLALPRDYERKWHTVAPVYGIDPGDTHALRTEMFARVHLSLVCLIASMQNGGLPEWVDVERLETVLLDQVPVEVDSVADIDDADPSLGTAAVYEEDLRILYADQALVALAVTASVGEIDVGEKRVDGE